MSPDKYGKPNPLSNINIDAFHRYMGEKVRPSGPSAFKEVIARYIELACPIILTDTDDM